MLTPPVHCQGAASGWASDFLESGSAMRASNVVMTAYSSIATAGRGDFDFDAIFEGVDWFHFTGITPAASRRRGRA